jgi:hypothetical protein
MGLVSKQAALALILLVAGCGQAPTSTRPILTDAAFDAPIPMAPTTVQPGQQAGAAQVQGQQARAALRLAYQRCTGFDSEIKNYSQGHY